MGTMLQRHALASSTNTKYKQHWRQWSGFARMMQWSRWLTCSARTACRRLRAFAVYLWRFGWNSIDRGNTYSTITLKLASVRWYHRRFLGVSIEQTPRLRILLQGIRRLSDPVHKKQPVTPAFLRLLRRTLDLTRPRHQLLWGSVVLGFFVLLRRSEYLRDGGKRTFFCLKAKNVFFSDNKGNRVTAGTASSVTIGLEGAKNDQFGRGAWRTMHASGDRLLCPVKALRHILKARASISTAARSSRHLCYDISSTDVARALKAAAERAGVPPAKYSTHSIRSGGATALLGGGADSLSIKLLGRWMSRCYEDYPVQAADATRGLSKRMI